MVVMDDGIKRSAVERASINTLHFARSHGHVEGTNSKPMWRLKSSVVVRTVEMCINLPGRNVTGEATSKGHVNTGVPKGGLERGGVISVLDL